MLCVSSISRQSRLPCRASSAPDFNTKRIRRTSRSRTASPHNTSYAETARVNRSASSEAGPQAAAAANSWLAKALASAGVASRRNCIELVKQGAVKVNGSVVTDPATKVTSRDVLQVHGRPVVQPAVVGYHYFAVNKPPGFICSNVSDKAPGKRAVDLLQPWLDKWQMEHQGQLAPRLFTVGRLDVATSGLIFLTNDGDWANKVIHPSANIIKEYLATVAQPPNAQQLEKLQAGTTIDGAHVAPKRVRVRPTAATGGRPSRCVVHIEVSEGKKHEVRLLVAAAGMQLLGLKRIRVGGWVMPRSLSEGSYMKLKPAELEAIFLRYKDEGQ